MLSHLFIDFFSGGVPFLYPVIEQGVGIVFPLTVSFGSGMTLQGFLPQLIFTTPESVHGKTIQIISGYGVVTTILLAIIWLSKGREKANLAQENR